MAIALGFWLFLLCAYAVILSNGRAAERWFLAIVLVATLSTLGVKQTLGPSAAPFGYLAIDSLLLAVTLAFVARVDRFWPIWFAGFHAITVATEFARILFPHATPYIYGNAAEFWALPALGSMACAVWSDRRASDRQATAAQPG